MLLKKIDEEELQFMEMWHYPVAMIESLFSNFDSLSEFEEDKFGELRLYQFPLPSYESMIDENMENLTENWEDLTKKEKAKERFELRKNVGDTISLGARKYGKTLCTEKLDIPLSMLHDDGWWTGCASLDTIHLRGVLDAIKPAIDNHPILKLWKLSIRTAHPYKIEAKNGWFLDGINMNLQSKNPGHQFFGKHMKKLWIEEASFETEKVYEKRQDALSELGAVIRLSGMTNFTEHSPTGKIFHNFANKAKIVNLPQYVNPYWNEKQKQERLKEFGGVDSINYRVFVKGEVVEDGVSEFDMDRVKECYKEKIEIKRFEIKKERYSKFQDTIVVERPKNAERMFICADVGDTHTEIIIHSEVGTKYIYLYNIVLYNLKFVEQLEIFKWIAEKIKANLIAIDCGEAFGRILCDHLEKSYTKENIVRYAGASKIPIDFEKNEKNEIILKNGKPITKTEFMSEWSVRRLKALLYDSRCVIPIDYKFETQFSSVMALQSGTRTTYKCIAENDHLFDAWRVFAIAQWLKKDFNQTPIMKQDWGIGASSWAKEKKPTTKTKQVRSK